MLAFDSPLPESITLNGADYFCWQLDGLMWKASRHRNVCTFAVSLAERLTLEALHTQLATRPVYQWLCQLRLRKSLPFTLAKWVHDPAAALPAIHEVPVDSADIPAAHLSLALDIKYQSAFNITLLQVENAGSILVFTWHHVLMDARGGEFFIRYLGLPQALKPVDWFADEAIKLPLKDRANIASVMKQFLYDTSKLPLLTLYKQSTPNQQTRYRVMSFSAQQSQAIIERAKQLDAGFLVSAFYLAATACAVAHIQQQRGLQIDDILVPVPLDKRKRGAQGAILGNQVSFLFYRIPSAVLNDAANCTSELIQQMKNLMRTGSPTHYSIMMDFLRRMPDFLYRHMLKAPTQGLMASFFYSDTGESLHDFNSLFGLPVHSAVHYPPNMTPPGMTIVFSRCQGALQITLGYMQDDLNPAEVELLLTTLHNLLLGAEDS